MNFRRTKENKSRLALVAGLLLVAGGALSSVSADGPAAPVKENREEKIPDEILPVGKECVLVLDQPSSGPMELAGRLDQANDRWLVIHVERERRSETGAPILSKTPYVNRLFKNVGIARTREDYWIPRERLLYLRVAEAGFERIGIDFDDNLTPYEIQSD
jgi:hypothetical protein